MKKIIQLSCLLFLAISCSTVSLEAASRTLDLSPFTGFAVTNSFNVVLKQGSKQSVRIEGDAKTIEDINTKVVGGVWKIETTSKNDNWSWGKQNNREQTTIYITIPKLTSVSVSGSGKVESSIFDVKDLSLALSGSGKISIPLESASDLAVKISGSGSVSVTGKANSISAQLSGSGCVKGSDLQVQTATARISGSGCVCVNASNSIDANISGSGNVYYSGNADVTSRVSGSGKVKKNCEANN